jgi:PAS domain-containing protein
MLNQLREDDEPLIYDPNVDMESMTPAERRRYERNLREQQRSYRISQQIKELREVLSESNVPFKPNKYSILMSVVEYIKQLQARAIMLDAEHQKLITTIRQTNELVNAGNTPTSADDTELTNSSDSGSDSEMLFVQGLDYRSVFEQSPASLGIAALDGRILECNPEFQTLLGFPRDDLLKQSLFNLVRNHQDIFRAMAEMLKSAEEPPANGATSASNSRFWSGPVVSKRDSKVRRSRQLKRGLFSLMFLAHISLLCSSSC